MQDWWLRWWCRHLWRPCRWWPRRHPHSRPVTISWGLCIAEDSPMTGIILRYRPWLRSFYCAAVPPLPDHSSGSFVLVGGSSRQRFLDTSWRFRGDTHTACVATKSPTGATGKIRRSRQRSTWPYQNAATLRISLLSKCNDQLEIYCSSYGRC